MNRAVQARMPYFNDPACGVHYTSAAHAYSLATCSSSEPYVIRLLLRTLSSRIDVRAPTSGRSVLCVRPRASVHKERRFLLKEMTFGNVKKFGDEIIYLGRQHAHPSREKIVKHLRRNCRDQSHCRGDKRLGNTWRDCLYIRRVSGR